MFCASWIRLRIWILLSISKKLRKILTSIVLWLHYKFLSLKNDVNVLSKRYEHKNLREKLFLLPFWRSVTKRAESGAGSGSITHGSKDLNTYASRSVPKCHWSGTLNRTHGSLLTWLSVINADPELHLFFDNDSGTFHLPTTHLPE
jgi:hypothetical protein